MGKEIGTKEERKGLGKGENYYVLVNSGDKVAYIIIANSRRKAWEKVKKYVYHVYELDAKANWDYLRNFGRLYKTTPIV